jgi:hypothetical protein
LKFSPFAVIVCSIVDFLPISHCSRGRAGWSTVRLQAGFVVPARVAFVVRPSMTAHRGIGSVPTARLCREPCRHHSRDQIDAGRTGWLDEQTRRTFEHRRWCATAWTRIVCLPMAEWPTSSAPWWNGNRSANSGVAESSGRRGVTGVVRSPIGTSADRQRLSEGWPENENGLQRRNRPGSMGRSDPCSA